jgi:hypothetical protein
MKNCLKCKYAEWIRTESGRLHTSGDGKCKYEYKIPALPQSMYWIGMSIPEPRGGYINRRSEMKNHCVYFQEGE